MQILGNFARMANRLSCSSQKWALRKYTAGASTKTAWLTITLDWLPVVGVLAAMLSCLRNAGNSRLWLVAMVVILGSRLLLSHRSRHRIRLKGWLHDIQAYAARSGKLPLQAVFFLAALPTTILCMTACCPRSVGDSWPVVPTAYSLITEGTWRVDEFAGMAYPHSIPNGAKLPYYLVSIQGHTYSKYPAGMVPFALPAAAMARALGVELDRLRTIRRVEAWTAAWVAGWCAAVFFLVALQIGRPAIAGLVTLFMVTGSALLSTVGLALWQHGGVMFWLMILLLVELRRGEGGTWHGIMVQGIACAMMLACRPSSALIIVCFGSWVLLRDPRRAISLAFLSLLAFVPWALFHWEIYGNLFGPSVWAAHNRWWSLDLAPEGLVGSLISPARGLVVYQPWILFVPVAALLYLILNQYPKGGNALPRGWHWFCVLAIVMHLTLIVGWRCPACAHWWGGHCWGSRLLTEIVPLFALLCIQPVSSLWENRWGRAVVAGMLAASFAVHAPAVYSKDYWEARVGLEKRPEMLWSWTEAPFLPQ